MTLLTSHMHGACQVLKFRGARFDASLVPEFKRCVQAVAQPMPKDLALDLSEVRFVDSSALGALVSLYRSGDGARVRLLQVTPPVHGLLKLTRMDRVFEVVDSLDPVAA